MSLNPDGQKSVEAIRARAHELASGETQRQGTRHAELLAALADGTVSFKDVPDAELERCVGELGADAVVDALLACSGPAGSAARQVRSVQPARIRFMPRFRFRLDWKAIPAMAALLAVLAAGAGGWFIYRKSAVDRGSRGVVLTADNRAARPPRVPQDISGGGTAATPAPTHNKVAGGTASATEHPGPTASPPPPVQASQDAAALVPPRVPTTNGETPAPAGGVVIGEKPETAGSRTAQTVVPEASARGPAVVRESRSAGGANTAPATEQPYVAVYPHLGDHPSATSTTPADQPSAAPYPRVGDQSASAIQKKLGAEFQLTKTNYDKSDIVTAGSVVVLQKDKVLMLAASSTNPCRNTYKDGQIKQSGPCAANEKMNKFSVLKSHIPGASSVPDSPSSHTFVTGEKFWVTKIEVRDAGKDPGIIFSFFTDAISDVRYATTLQIPFGAFAPTPDEALKLVQEVIRVAPADDAKKDDKAQAAPSPPADDAPAPIAPPPPFPTEVAEGQTVDQVIAALGRPQRTAKAGNKEIYFYKDLKVTFVNGKVKEVE
jgi:hypothetical protein